MGSVYGPNIVTDNLILYVDAGNVQSYPGSGTTWYDIVGSNDGVITNATYSSTDGGVIVFDGSGDYVMADNHNIPSLESFSVSLWLKYGGTPSAHRIPFWISDAEGTPNFLYIEIGSGYNYLGVATETFSQNKYSTAAAGINDDNWQHIAVTRNSGTVLIYKDGIVVTTTAHNMYGGWNTGPGKDLSIGVGMDNGNIYSSSSVTGSIASVIIYNKALTAAEVLQNYNAHKSRFGL